MIGGAIILIAGWYLIGYFQGIDPVVFFKDRIQSVLSQTNHTPYEVTTNPEQQTQQAEEYVDQKLQGVQKNIEANYGHLKEYHVPGKIIQGYLF